MQEEKRVIIPNGFTIKGFLHVPYSLPAPCLNPMVKVSYDHSITENTWLKMLLKINIPETARQLTEGHC